MPEVSWFVKQQLADRAALARKVVDAAPLPPGRRKSLLKPITGVRSLYSPPTSDNKPKPYRDRKPKRRRVLPVQYHDEYPWVTKRSK